jgi:hypothetical protein
MPIFDIFKREATLRGEVLLRDLPPHKMYCVSVTFFPVASANSPVPFDGDPPIDNWTNGVWVKETDEPDDKPLHFCVERTAGHYYLGISAIVFLDRNGEWFAQVERFLPMTSPCEIPAGGEQQFCCQ